MEKILKDLESLYKLIPSFNIGTEEMNLYNNLHNFISTQSTNALQIEVERLRKIEKKWNILKLNYTCYSCKSESNCPSAWDGYNTSGDCLEEK